jgi:ubiquinone/menaquinone biosynthesis C-methylase UbiE
VREEGHPHADPTDEDGRRLAQVYERYARSSRKRRAWTLANRGNAQIRAELTRELLRRADPALRHGRDVLDVGCGTGWWLHTLARHGVAPKRLHGVDLLPDRVAEAARRVPGGRIQVASALALPYPADSFALVTLVTVLGSLPSAGAIRAALREAHRVTAPAGSVLVYEPRYPNLLNRSRRHVPPSRVAEVFAEAEVTSLTVLPPLARRLGAAAAPLYSRLARVPGLRTHYLATVRKPDRR